MEKERTYEDLQAYAQQLENKLSVAERFIFQEWNKIIQQLPSSIIIFTPSLNIIDCNPAFNSAFHYSTLQIPSNLKVLFPTLQPTDWNWMIQNNILQETYLIDGISQQVNVRIKIIKLQNQTNLHYLYIENKNLLFEQDTILHEKQQTIQELIAHNQLLENANNSYKAHLDALKKQYNILEKHLPGIVYLCLNNEDFTMLHLNERIQDYTGIPREYFLNGEVKYNSLIHPEDQKHHETINESVENKQPFYLVYRIKHISGKWLWVEEFGTGVYENNKLTHLEGFILKIDKQKNFALALKRKNRDIQELNLKYKKQYTQLNIVNKELQASQSLYKDLVNKINFGILLIQQKHITFCNPAACKILAVSTPNDILDKSIHLIIPNEISWLSQTGRLNIQQKKMTVERIDKKRITIELSAYSVVFDNKTSILLSFRDISREIKNKKLLKTSESRYRKLFQAAGTGMAIYSEHEHFLMVNDNFLVITGFTKHEVLNELNWSDFMPPGYHRPQMVDLFKDIKSDKPQQISREISIITKNQEIRNVFLQINSLPESQEYIVSIIDITSQHKAQENVRKLNRAIEQSPTAIIVTNRTGSIEYVNPKYEQITGYSYEEVKGRKPNALRATILDQKQYSSIKKAIQNGQEWRGEILDQHKDGSSFWGYLRISPVTDENNKINNLILIEEDITRRKHLENELITAKEKAEESDKLKSAFLANMSHEIRTPMNGILGFAQLLRTPNLTPEKTNEYTSIIDSRGKHLLRIIQDIVDISKIESGQIKPQIQSFSLNLLLEDIYLFFKEDIAKKGLHFTMNFGLKEHEDWILSDNYKVQQILTNLIFNAIKYTQKGAIQVGYKLANDHTLIFFVKDSGTGIPKEQHQLIFERFRQVDNTYTRKHGGTGLGLAICRALVELLNGKIWVESTPGHGSLFKFTLPWYESPDKKNNSSNKIQQKPDWNHKKILIVEDDRTSMSLITTILKETRATIAQAENGYEAIELANRFRPDAILMDIQLPELDGLSAAVRIHKLMPRVPIIAQTAHALANDKDKVLKHGCVDYLTKPLKVNSLLTTLKKYLG